MFKTLYAKISAIFLLLILLMGLTQIYLSINSSVNYVCEATQKLNFNLAAQIASRCEPFFQDSIHHSRLMTTVKDFHQLNPHANIFIIDPGGNILATSLSKNKLKRLQIDVSPVQRFLSLNSYNTLPILGDDPASADQKRIFSATEISMGKMGKAYLYVTLASTRNDFKSGNLLGSYILRSASIAILATMLFAAAIGLVLFFLLTKRVHEITAVVKKFTTGDYSQRIFLQSNDEMAEMASAFNFMAQTIEKNIQELQKNDNQRRELIANISHDLRSPLASIQGYIETILMKQDQLPAAEQKDFLKITLKNVIQLNQQVNQLFELSKLDTNRIKPSPEIFSLTELVQDVVLKFNPLAEEKNIILETQAETNLPFVRGDIGMIDRAISNLIDNAIKYSNPNGHIYIRLERRQNAVFFIIRDEGSGIAAEDLPHIFDRFYMADKSRTKGKHGSGLGLAIAQRILEAHKSVLSVESKAGEGTQFAFSLSAHSYSNV